MADPVVAFEDGPQQSVPTASSRRGASAEGGGPVIDAEFIALHINGQPGGVNLSGMQGGEYEGRGR